MKTRWNDADAAGLAGELGPRVYTARLLSSEPSLTGCGGTMSVKSTGPGVLGRTEDLLYLAERGGALSEVDAESFTALRLESLRALASLDDPGGGIARELCRAAVDLDVAPVSPEAMLHAALPQRYVDHTHAGSVLALTNTPSAEQHVRRAYGECAIVVPWTRPGPLLARLCGELIERRMTDATIGLVLMNHGLISFGETARESYERMIALVARAEDYLAAHGAGDLPASASEVGNGPVALRLAGLRARISSVAGFPVVLRHDRDPVGAAFAARTDVAALSQSGPAIPEHAILTKRIPLVGSDVDGYAASYRAYIQTYAAGRDGREPTSPLDPAPRIVLDPELGLCTAGRTAEEADTAAEIYKQTIDLILRASALEQWRALPPSEVFSVEAGALETQEPALATGGFAGETVLVTGAASGIGAACVEAFLARGAAVFGVDINPAVVDAFARPSYLGVVGDITQEEDVCTALEQCAERFGGLDMLVLSAGIFPPSRRLDALDLTEWRRVFAINTDADLLVMRLVFPFLELAPNGGRVVVIASKNVPAPGPGAAAYSASKAALTQLARIAALEWGQAGIRVNVIHPNAVFDTGIWNDEVIAARAAQYGVTPEEYRTQNVLHVEVASKDVAELAVAMCGPAFAKTTGAQVPVDGGNERVI